MNELGLPFEEEPEAETTSPIPARTRKRKQADTAPVDAAADAESPTPKNELGFEKSLQRLEKIVEEMESGSLPLEQSLQCFEEGSRLAAHCTATLEATEKKVEILMKNSRGESAWKEFHEQKPQE